MYDGIYSRNDLIKKKKIKCEEGRETRNTFKISNKISVLSLILYDFICFGLDVQPAEIFGGLFTFMLQKSDFCGKEK